MRLRNRRLQILQLKTKAIKEDKEGNKFPSYLDPIDVEVEVWPASSKLQVELYGNRIAAIMNMASDIKVNINVDDAIVYDHHDHKVISKKTYTQHCVYEIERL